MRICSQLLLLFEIQHVFQFNSPCLPVKSSEIPIVSSEIHHFPKIFLNSLTMFPSDVPLIFLRKKITFFHVFPSLKKTPVSRYFARYLPRKSHWNPGQIPTDSSEGMSLRWCPRCRCSPMLWVSALPSAPARRWGSGSRRAWTLQDGAPATVVAFSCLKKVAEWTMVYGCLW